MALRVIERFSLTNTDCYFTAQSLLPASGHLGDGPKMLATGKG